MGDSDDLEESYNNIANQRFRSVRANDSSVEIVEETRTANRAGSWSTGWGRISDIMLEPISETIYAVDTISQLPKAC